MVGRSALSMRKWRAENPERARLKMREMNQRNRQWLVDIKMASGCMDCGYNEHPDALEFDHLPGSEKLFGIGTSVSRSREVLAREIAKCEVVCSNCHHVRTATRREEESEWTALKAS